MTIVVGTILNLINQGTEWADGHGIVIWKLALTYFVPFAVASYGSYSAFRSMTPPRGAEPHLPD